MKLTDQIKKLNRSLIDKDALLLIYSLENKTFQGIDYLLLLFPFLSFDSDILYYDMIDLLPIKHQEIILDKIERFPEERNLDMNFKSFIYESRNKINIELKFSSENGHIYIYVRKLDTEVSAYNNPITLFPENFCIWNTEYFKNAVSTLENAYFRNISKIFQFSYYLDFKVWHLNIEKKKIIMQNGAINNFKLDYGFSKRFMFKNLDEYDFDIFKKWYLNSIAEKKFSFFFLKIKNDKNLSNKWNNNYLYYIPGSDIETENIICITKEVDEINNNKYELEKIIRHIKHSESVKTHFLTHLSHELRTPLNIITGFSELLLNDKNNYQTEYNHAISIANKSLLSQINSISEYISIINNQFKIVPHYIALWDFLNSLKNEYNNGENSSVRIMLVNMKDDSTVLSDKYLLHIALSKLLDNAINNTTSGYILIEYVVSDGKVDIIVTDSGSGIKTNDINRVVLPFEKSDEFSSGVGLGLPIVKTIALKLGAEIKISSEVGIGTSIYFTINTKSDFIPYISTYENEYNDMVANKKKKVIFIFGDNDSLSLFSLKNIFPHYNFKIFYDEEQFIEAQYEERPNLFIIDIENRQRRNYIINDVIRQISPNKKIIICRCLYEKDDSGNSISDNLNLFINKPIAIPEMREQIITALYNKIYE